MRIVFVGASNMAVATARKLIDKGHDVVIIDRDRDKLDLLADELDCGMVVGDGSHPSVLREAAAGQPDILFCLSDDDQDNILAALVGRSIGFERVIPRIQEQDFRNICAELKLEDTITPDETMSQHLVDSVIGREDLALSSIITGDVRLFALTIEEGQAATVADLELPSRTRVICVYREEDYFLPEPDSELKKGDRVVVITHSDALESLHESWGWPENGRRDTETGAGD